MPSIRGYSPNQGKPASATFLRSSAVDAAESAFPPCRSVLGKKWATTRDREPRDQAARRGYLQLGQQSGCMSRPVHHQRALGNKESTKKGGRGTAHRVRASRRRRGG